MHVTAVTTVSWTLQVSLFANVEDGFMHALAQKMENVTTAIAEAILVEGGMPDALYIVLRGQVSMYPPASCGAAHSWPDGRRCLAGHRQMSNLMA